MARGKQTDITLAMVAYALWESGFEETMITKLLGIPRPTVGDIVSGRGRWLDLTDNELFPAISLKVQTALLENAEKLTQLAIKRIEERLGNASLLESVNVLHALNKVLGD